jgi:hypothetical protein
MRVSALAANTLGCAPRSKATNETSAKEGGVPVASAQPFPFPDRKAAPRAAAAPADSPRPKSIVAAPHRPLPVLARIPDVTIGPRPRSQSDGDNNRAVTPASSGPRYRLDAAHSSTVEQNDSRPIKARKPAKDRPKSPNNGLEQFSATIRFAVNTWEFLQPYQPALRTAAMFLLMALSSMSVMLMIGPRWKQPAAPQPTAASDRSELTPLPTNRSAELLREPDANTTMVPTATGPGRQKYNPSDDEPSSPAEPVASHRSEASDPPTELRLNGPLAAHGPGAKPGVSVNYPTTPYPTTNLPIISAESLPQVRMTDEAPAVARLRGDILESQQR